MGRLHKHILCGNCPNYTPSPPKQPPKPDQENIKICIRPPLFSFLDTHSSKNDFAFGNQNFVGQYFMGFILFPPNRPDFCFSSELSAKKIPNSADTIT